MVEVSLVEKVSQAAKVWPEEKISIRKKTRNLCY
jgi:hypothetical protein